MRSYIKTEWQLYNEAKIHGHGNQNPLVGYYEQFFNVPKFLYIPGPINVLSIIIGL